MTEARIESVQRACNRFTGRYLRGVKPLIVDGRWGPATRRRIRDIQFFLGYGKRDSKVTRAFLNRMAQPRSSKYSPRSLWMRGSRRRVAQRARHRSESVRSVVAPGVTRYNGVPCAKWMVSYLSYARRHGWSGQLNSGWRSPAYSDSLCRRICGRPQCPGVCAGRASNHAGSARPRGALDVSDYARFGRIMRGCPYSPRIYNDLPRDRIHFSASGR